MSKIAAYTISCQREGDAVTIGAHASDGRVRHYTAAEAARILLDGDGAAYDALQLLHTAATTPAGLTRDAFEVWRERALALLKRADAMFEPAGRQEDGPVTYHRPPGAPHA